MKYGPPFPEGTKYKVVVPESHKKYKESENAIDLAVALGTKILAIKDGIVTGIKDDSETPFHPDEVEGKSLGEKIRLSFLYLNYIGIRHDDETHAVYGHTGKRVCVEVGQRVKKGDVIGEVGMNGITSEPHLHLTVEEIKSLPIEFEE